MQSRIVLFSVGVAAAIPGALLAHGGEDHGAAAHHPTRTKNQASVEPAKELEAGAFRFQVAFDDLGLMIMVSRKDGAVFPSSRLAAKVLLKQRGARPQEARLTPAWDESGKFRHFELKRDFSDIVDGSTRAEFEVRALDPQGVLSFWTILRRSPQGHAPQSHAGVPAVANTPYPLGTCVVSGEKLGDHGAPIDHMHEGRLVRLCCKGCLKDFKETPQRYLSILDRAELEVTAPEVPSQSGNESSHRDAVHGDGHDHSAHGH